MKIKVHDLMSTNVITLQPHLTAQQVKEKFSAKKIKSAPVVDGEGLLIGIVSATDLMGDISDTKPVSSIMTEKVYSVPEYEGVEIAARVMRNHKIHHLIVTRDKKVIGVISSYDLLKLVEDKKFEMKNASTPRKKGAGARKRAEA